MFETKKMDERSNSRASSPLVHLPPGMSANTKQPRDLPGSRYFLQRNLGNSSMQSMFQRRSTSGTVLAPSVLSAIGRDHTNIGSSSCCSGNSAAKAKIQTKLTVGPADDVYEQEADRVAAQVMRTPDSNLRIQNQPNLRSNIQRISSSDGNSLEFDSNIRRNKSIGCPLSNPTRTFMEPRFGMDFGHVRLHTDQQAHQAAAQIHAKAFTFGNHIWLGKGAKESDKTLMAHELTHVVQQVAGSVVDMHEPSVTPNSTPIMVQRIPTISSDCSEVGGRNIIEAQQQAIAWIRHSISRLHNASEITPELSWHFNTIPQDARTIGIICTELEGLLAELTTDTIAYGCVPDTDPRCSSEELPEIAGFSPFLGSHEAYFCGDRPLQGFSSLTSLLIHEALHAKAPGIPDGPYRGDPDYPGTFPIANTDAYTGLVEDLSTGIEGLPERPVGEEFGMVLGEGYTSSSDPIHLTTDLNGFPPGDATLTAEAMEYLWDFLENWFEYEPDGFTILRVAGHTDGTSLEENNTTLGMIRAEVVRDFLLLSLHLYGIHEPVQVEVANFSASRPFTGSRTPRGTAMNRRVEIEVFRIAPREQI